MQGRGAPAAPLRCAPCRVDSSGNGAPASSLSTGGCPILRPLGASAKAINSASGAVLMARVYRLDVLPSDLSIRTRPACSRWCRTVRTVRSQTPEKSARRVTAGQQPPCSSQCSASAIRTDFLGPVTGTGNAHVRAALLMIHHAEAIGRNWTLCSNNRGYPPVRSADISLNPLRGIPLFGHRVWSATASGRRSRYPVEIHRGPRGRQPETLPAIAEILIPKERSTNRVAHPREDGARARSQGAEGGHAKSCVH